MDLIKSEKEKQEDTEDLQGEDFRILAEGFFWSELHIEIDRKEEELKFRDDDWVTGECIHCGTHTTGNNRDED
ncbi:hypothetical protein MHB54_25160 [Paenibacillus sp. FSL M7-0802]|jgi:hypothetical protein|uniref:hypothetical protein n=1 Tax=Paenibacillus TaxID=44249 RepID=UPI002222E551|nr:hypothetical protein [Paenibacillus polymyxa]